jgi:hypothetical protein
MTISSSRRRHIPFTIFITAQGGALKDFNSLKGSEPTISSF